MQAPGAFGSKVKSGVGRLGVGGINVPHNGSTMKSL
jgi:hypothetical protein